jgi:hypothetical protein
MTKQKYNIWYALAYEIIIILRDEYKILKSNKYASLILNYCKSDWVLWKVERTLKEVDKEVEQIKKDWEKLDVPKFEIIEHKPDGSKAQELLGGAIEIRSTFKRN